MSARRIEDYGLIGDGETAALVGRDGAIDWLCLPRFDSPACFAALLGSSENGCWRLAPAHGDHAASRRYDGDTLILETDYRATTGRALVRDFMPMRGEAPDVVRIVEGLEGDVEMLSDLALRFDYGRIHPLVRTLAEDRVLAIAGPDAVLLDFDVPIAFEDRRFTSRFTVKAGDRIGLVMTHFASHARVPRRVDPQLALRETRRHWQQWIGRARIEGPHGAAVKRSLLTLGALVHRPTGGMVAAPSASLPERIGGSRNWDYRFCWPRDSTFMLLALLQAGLHKEAEAWFDWLRRAVGGEPIDVQPLYRPDGGRRILEWEAGWLPGFAGSQPVRFGNDAAGQLQLDAYGEVIDTLFEARARGIERDDDSDQLVRLLADRLEELWRRPGAGLWESRGPPRHHVYSKVMCWVGFERAARWFEKGDRTRSRDYAALAEEVRAEILAKGVDPEGATFVAAYGETSLDAALLRLPLVGFVDARDPRMVATVAAIERRLLRGGLVHRYRPDEADDGIGEGEGAFVAASFWLADVYILQGRHDEARALFERLAALTNDLGLLAEQHDGRHQLGNFPQGLSHLSLVVTAMNLAGSGPAERRARAAAPRLAARS